MVFGSLLWASWCIGSMESLGTLLGSSRDEFREFPGRVSGFLKQCRRSQPAEPETPNSGSKFFGMENPAPAESTVFNAAGGKPWPFSRKASFARRRAVSSPDSVCRVRADSESAFGVPFGGVLVENRLGAENFSVFALASLGLHFSWIHRRASPGRESGG